jgi:hypothetical protein
MWPTIIFHMVDTIISPFFVIIGRLLEQRELVRTLSINIGIVVIEIFNCNIQN